MVVYASHQSIEGCWILGNRIQEFAEFIDGLPLIYPAFEAEVGDSAFLQLGSITTVGRAGLFCRHCCNFSSQIKQGALSRANPTSCRTERGCVASGFHGPIARRAIISDVPLGGR
jgi:hypothetical protein